MTNKFPEPLVRIPRVIWHPPNIETDNRGKEKGTFCFFGVPGLPFIIVDDKCLHLLV
jgi:hypothetical protein